MLFVGRCGNGAHRLWSDGPILQATLHVADFMNQIACFHNLKLTRNEH